MITLLFTVNSQEFNLALPDLSKFSYEVKDIIAEKLLATIERQTLYYRFDSDGYHNQLVKIHPSHCFSFIKNNKH